MKHKTLLLTLFAAAAVMAGCNKKETTSRQLDKVQQSTAEAARDMQDYAFVQKTEFTENMQAQLDELNRELDQLSARIERSSASVKADAQPRIQALRDQTAVLSKQLDEARNATESSWHTVKSDFKKSYDASKTGFQEARQWLSEKIAP